MVTSCPAKLAAFSMVMMGMIECVYLCARPAWAASARGDRARRARCREARRDRVDRYRARLRARAIRARAVFPAEARLAWRANRRCHRRAEGARLFRRDYHECAR